MFVRKRKLKSGESHDCGFGNAHPGVAWRACMLLDDNQPVRKSMPTFCVASSKRCFSG